MPRRRLNPPHIVDAFADQRRQLRASHRARRLLREDNARMATELEAAQREIDRVTAERDELIRIGSQFANLAFNTTQGAQPDIKPSQLARMFATLKSLREQWDGARDRHCDLNTSLARKTS